MSQTLFKENDLVEAFGSYGRVTQVGYASILVRFGRDEAGREVRFTLDGKLQSWHILPSLKLQEWPKRKVTKTIVQWANVYPNGVTVVWSTEKEANRYANENRVTCAHLTGTYEVEEDI